jgi:hypothetical protein
MGGLRFRVIAFDVVVILATGVHLFWVMCASASKGILRWSVSYRDA